VHIRLEGLYGILLIVQWTRRASKIENTLNFEIERESNIMQEKCEVTILQCFPQIRFISGEEVVYSNHLMPVSQKPISQMRSQKPSSSGDQDSHPVAPWFLE
jgi:hypothetical protein